MRIRPVDPADTAETPRIYNYCIANSHAAFEVEAVDDAEMKARIAESFAKDLPFVVCEIEGGIAG